MGTSYYVHLGPYLRVKKKMVDGLKSIRCCSNQVCKKYRDEIYDNSKQFCQNCGGAITTDDYAVKQDWFDHYDILSEYEDSLISWAYNGPSKSEYHYLFPNHEGGRKFSLEPAWESVEWPSSELKVEEEVSWFNKKYAEELKLIGAVVGNSMEVCWGLITYAN